MFATPSIAEGEVLGAQEVAADRSAVDGSPADDPEDAGALPLEEERTSDDSPAVDTGVVEPHLIDAEERDDDVRERVTTWGTPYWIEAEGDVTAQLRF